MPPEQEQIAALAMQGESEILAFKSATGTHREMPRTVYAMLNHCGRKMLFGVTPDRDVIGPHADERTIEEVSVAM